MNELHIDDFYKDAARILLALYLQFPRPVSIYVADISGIDNVDEYGLHSERHDACLHTMLWLAEEQLLRYTDTIYREGIDHAVLTHKAMQWLSARHADGTAAQAMQQALDSQSTIRINQVMSRCLRLDAL